MLSPATRCARSPDERRKLERRHLRRSTGPRGLPLPVKMRSGRRRPPRILTSGWVALALLRRLARCAAGSPGPLLRPVRLAAGASAFVGPRLLGLAAVTGHLSRPAAWPAGSSGAHPRDHDPRAASAAPWRLPRDDHRVPHRAMRAPCGAIGAARARDGRRRSVSGLAHRCHADAPQRTRPADTRMRWSGATRASNWRAGSSTSRDCSTSSKTSWGSRRRARPTTASDGRPYQAEAPPALGRRARGAARRRHLRHLADRGKGAPRWRWPGRAPRRGFLTPRPPRRIRGFPQWRAAFRHPTCPTQKAEAAGNVSDPGSARPRAACAKP